MKQRRFLLSISLILGALLFPATALAGTAPSITSSFTPSTIPSGGTSTLSYTITNHDSGQGLTGVQFTDSLPAGLTVANPSGVSGSCGSGTFTATAGSSTISLSGGTLNASGTAGDTCTVSANVTSSSPGVLHNSTGTVSSTQDGSGNSDAETLTVVAPPSITSSFIPSTIGVGGSSTLSFTISNPGTAKTLTGIGFTDTLPSGVVVDNPNGVSAKCGSSAVLTATSGSSTIQLTGGQLAPGASCTVSANVTSSAAAIYQNSTGNVSSNEGGTGNGDYEILTVVDPPGVTITTPPSGATYSLGQSVLASYSCQDATNGPGIADCVGDVPNGSAINTNTPGHRTFSVTAISQDGQVTTDTVRYTVMPSNQFSVSELQARPGGDVIFVIDVPDAGALDAVAHAVVKGRSGEQPVLFGHLVARQLIRRGAYGVVVHMTPAGKQLFDQVWKANHASSRGPREEILITPNVTFTPTGGTARTRWFGRLGLWP